MVELLRSPRRLILFVFEVVLIGLLVLGAHCLRLGVHEAMTAPFILFKSFFFATVSSASFYYSGLYDFSFVATPRSVYQKLVASLPLAIVFLLCVYYLIPSLEIGRGVFLVSFAFVAIALPLWRRVYYKLAAVPALTRKTMILGTGTLARELATLIRNRTDLGLSLEGFLARDTERVSPASGIYGTYNELVDVVSRNQIELVLVAFPDRRGNLPIAQLLEIKFRGVDVQEGVDFYEAATGKLFIRELKPSQLIFAEGFTARSTSRRLKRMLDVFVSSLGLILASPLMLATALLIKLDSPGPILYRQIRAGQFGRLFTILKFRSMRTDAEKHGAQFAQLNDARVTRIGQFIRKTRIDELPQLWNVLRGDMSMVGPRPERPVFITQLEKKIPYFSQRLYVKPGVTGHAQVRSPYGATDEDMVEKVQYDLYYIKSYSLLFDLSILLDTVRVVLLRVGSR
jgi:sugar transferase (PEP-CTERM system associated)